MRSTKYFISLAIVVSSIVNALPFEEDALTAERSQTDVQFENGQDSINFMNPYAHLKFASNSVPFPKNGYNYDDESEEDPNLEDDLTEESADTEVPEIPEEEDEMFDLNDYERKLKVWREMQDIEDEIKRRQSDIDQGDNASNRVYARVGKRHPLHTYMSHKTPGAYQQVKSTSAPPVSAYQSGRVW